MILIVGLWKKLIVIVLKIKIGLDELVNDMSFLVLIVVSCFFWCSWEVIFVFEGNSEVMFIVKVKFFILGIWNKGFINGFNKILMNFIMLNLISIFEIIKKGSREGKMIFYYVLRFFIEFFSVFFGYIISVIVRSVMFVLSRSVFIIDLFNEWFIFFFKFMLFWYEWNEEF